MLHRLSRGCKDKTTSRREYLERFGRIDIALDTYPFNGITTTCDGLWMGVAAVSLAGQTSVSRAGKSILIAAGLAELAATTSEAFVGAPASLASDLPNLAKLRLDMPGRLAAVPLLDHRGFAARLEAAYVRMWERWRAAS